MSEERKPREYNTLEELIAATVAMPLNHNCARLILLVQSPKGVMLQEAQGDLSVLQDDSGEEGTGKEFASSILNYLYSGCKDIL